MFDIFFSVRCPWHLFLTHMGSFIPTIKTFTILMNLVMFDIFFSVRCPSVRPQRVDRIRRREHCRCHDTRDLPRCSNRPARSGLCYHSNAGQADDEQPAGWSDHCQGGMLGTARMINMRDGVITTREACSGRRG